jgi:hypothetical protein
MRNPAILLLPDYPKKDTIKKTVTGLKQLFHPACIKEWIDYVLQKLWQEN